MDIDEEDLHAIQMIALYTSLIGTSSLLSVLLSWFVIGCLTRDGGERRMGRFGKFMLTVEIMDAIPEAVIVANATVEGDVSWSFVFALCATNLAVSLMTCIDLMSTRGSPRFHRILFCMNMATIGMLCYAVPLQTFQSFKDREMKERAWAYGIGWIAGGTLVGVIFVALLVVVEEKVSSRSEGSDRKRVSRLLKTVEDIRDNYRSFLDDEKRRREEEEEEEEEEDEEDDEDSKGDDEMKRTLTKSIKHDEEGHRKCTTEEEGLLLNYDRRKGPTPSKSGGKLEGKGDEYDHRMDRDRQQEEVEGLIPKEDSERGDGVKDLLEYEIKRDTEYAKRLNDLESRIRIMNGMKDVLECHPDSWILKGMMEGTEEDAKEELSIREESGGVPSLWSRACRILLAYILVAIWTSSMAMGFAFLFIWIKRGEDASIRSYVDSLSEGISAGAFLASISGTLIPRLMQDASGSGWPLMRIKMLSIVLFLSGLGASVSLDIAESVS